MKKICEYCFNNNAYHEIMENSFYYKAVSICCECYGSCYHDEDGELTNVRPIW